MSILPVGFVVVLAWVVFVLSDSANGSGLNRGILPRTANGLLGIFTAPVWHLSMDHLLSNTPLFVGLGGLISMRRGPIEYAFITAQISSLSGILIWLLGKGGASYTGASGLVFGYAGYVLLVEKVRPRTVVAGLFIVAGYEVTRFTMIGPITLDAHLLAVLSGGIVGIASGAFSEDRES